MVEQKKITILGSTGSIGLSTLDVVRRHPKRFTVFALTAHSRLSELIQQIIEFQPVYAVMADESLADSLRNRLRELGSETQVVGGQQGLIDVAGSGDTDFVMAAIVGAAGLLPTLAAVKAGKRVLLANKEALVMGGALFMDAVKKHGAELLPIDSEHNAIYQCLPQDFQQGLVENGIARILLTASGGPFRDLPMQQLQAVTPAQACAHPNWDMGPKISVDSATMMNKGLELIEACWLFGARPNDVEIIIHPQSVIHSMVEYTDGSVLAQLGNPDMRTPIAYGLAWPDRVPSGVPLLDLVKVAKLDFLAPDEQRFPCLRLARQAMVAGGSASVALNAANEEAVAAFLKGGIPFTGIAQVIEEVLQMTEFTVLSDIESILSADAEARRLAQRRLSLLTNHSSQHVRG